MLIMKNKKIAIGPQTKARRIGHMQGSYTSNRKVKVGMPVLKFMTKTEIK